MDGEEHEFRGEFKGIQTKLKVSFIENHHPIFLDDGSMLDTIPKNHENSLVLHSRVYPYEDQPYGEIIFEGEEKHLSCDAIIMMMNLVSIHPTIPTTRLEGIRKGSNPLQVLQYLNHRKSSLRREQWVGNEILGGTWVPGEYFIKTIKDYYLFITGEECKVLDSPDFLFDQGKKYGKYNLKEDPEVQYMTSGQQHLLLLLIRICTARGGLLLLDEIELGLHEGYLERLSILINRNKKDLPQMLVSTHSPIFAGLNIENTHFIEKNGAGQ